MASKIQLRRDTSARWQQINPVLGIGEPGYETDSGRIKIGDGNTVWNSLSYFANGSVALSQLSQLENDVGFITAEDIPEVVIPTTLSSFTNDTGFITAASIPAVPTNLSSFNNDTGFVTSELVETLIPTNLSDLTNDLGFITSEDIPAIPSDISDLTDTEGLLGQGDFSGSYNDLTDKPTIPSVVSQLTNDTGFITSEDIPTIPSDISDLTDTEGLLGQGGSSSAVLPYVELTNIPFITQPVTLGTPVEFIRTAEGSETDPIDTGLTLARGAIGALYNIESEVEYDRNNYTSPLGTEWNSDGWGDLLDLRSRSYTTLRSALNNQIGNNIIGVELIMHDTINDKYYTFSFTEWGENNGGSFAYTRTQVTDPNFFQKTDNGSEVDIIIPDDGAGAGVGITRGVNQGIYNPYREGSWDSAVSPDGTLWNIDGWDDLSNVETRTYEVFNTAYNGNLGNNVPGSKAVMYVPDNGTYYAVEWLSWTPNNAGGGFSYTRKEIDLTQIREGVKFADGTVLKSAEGLGRVKSTAVGDRRIEEAVGYKEVSVTERVTTDYIGSSARTTSSNFEIFVKRTPELDAVLQPIWNNVVNAEIEISFDNITFVPSFLSTIQETPAEYWFYYSGTSVQVPQTEDNPVYIRTISGADPVVWWDKNDLPAGGANFRGAVIDYHAYTGEATWIGTIHIVDDDGEEHIAHTEVSSGSSDSENDYLWLVENEGRISYRRIDGEAKTLKVHWTAKVFYGSELYD